MLKRVMLTNEKINHSVNVGDKFTVILNGNMPTPKRRGGRKKAQKIIRWKVIEKYETHALCDCGLYKECFTYTDILRSKAGRPLTEEN